MVREILYLAGFRLVKLHGFFGSRHRPRSAFVLVGSAEEANEFCGRRMENGKSACDR
jgi:hypothetical protein